MIQINLIPDLKAEFLKAQKIKRTVVSLSLVAVGVFAGLVVVMFLHVNVNQKNHTDNLKEDIDKLATEYSAAIDLDKVITVQKQLQALPGLHESKPLVSRLAKYLTIITPENVEITRFSLDLEEKLQISIAGNGASVADVNVFADTIKNATFRIDDDEEDYDPFSNVILENIAADDEGAIYVISFSFDEQLFTNHGDITLTVPKGDFTLSEVESPKLEADRKNDLFDTEETEEVQ